MDTDDVAQQAWTQSLAAYPRLRSTSSLRDWLLTLKYVVDLDHPTVAKTLGTTPARSRSLVTAGAGRLPGPGDREAQRLPCSRCRPGRQPAVRRTALPPLASSGALTGYAGGLAAKECLLALESRH